MVLGETGERHFGTAYYQSMVLWPCEDYWPGKIWLNSLTTKTWWEA